MAESPLLFLQLIGFTAGTVLNLFLMILVLGYRRPRAVERLLFFVALAAFLFHAGNLLLLNAELHYGTPPEATLRFALGVSFLGLAFLPALLVHLHAEYFRTQQDVPWSGGLKTLVVAGYAPLLYFLPFAVREVLGGLRAASPMPAGTWGVVTLLWIFGALVSSAVFQSSFVRQATARYQRGFHLTLAVFFALAAAALLLVLLGGILGYADWAVRAAVLLAIAPVVPSALLGYFILRYDFLQIGVQRNLVFAVSAGFVAVLYLTVVSRISMWLEPHFPPVATTSILVFLLVFFFEPLQRSVSRGLERLFRGEIERLQRLTAEVQQEARSGELDKWIAFVERRVREEFSLAHVRVSLRGGPERKAVASGNVRRFPLRRPAPYGAGWRESEEIGVLEAYHYGAILSGETQAALETLAGQLPAALDLCRLIEEKLKLERELAERERLALLGQMAASISHNLKNPLGSMKTLLQVQLENPELPESLRKDCAMVVAEVDRLNAKLSQLLQYAKPAVRAGTGGERVDAAALAAQIVELLERDAERRGVQLAFARPPEAVFVPGSEQALSDVLQNLIVNAVEAVPAGGAIRVVLERRGREVVLSVTDDGPGIPADVREKIFQPFFTTKAAGTGLGLAIVARRLAELHGNITCESPTEKGRGTRFTVTLPLAEQTNL